MSRFRNFCFTTFNVRELSYNEEDMRYLVYQVEECPDTGKEHLQGYCELHKQLRMPSIKQLFDDEKMHIEARKGTAQQAADYCKKEDTRVRGPYEFGKISNPGKRTDLDKVTEMVQERKTIHEIAQECPKTYIKYNRGIVALKAALDPPALRPQPVIEYHWGEPRTGKSKYAHETYPDAYCAIDSRQGWFDLYEGQDTVIFDEFEGLFPDGLMRRLIDRYPLALPIKGGTVPVRAYRFIFTSNRCPAQVFSKPMLARLREWGRVQYYPATSESGPLSQDM